VEISNNQTEKEEKKTESGNMKDLVDHVTSRVKIRRECTRPEGNTWINRTVEN
jgi:hypothetical protein